MLFPQLMRSLTSFQLSAGVRADDETRAHLLTLVLDVTKILCEQFPESEHAQNRRDREVIKKMRLQNYTKRTVF